MGELEFTEEELLLLNSPQEFHKWLYSLHEEVEITDVDELLKFWKEKNNEWNVSTLITFKKYILNE